jgi:endonuclease/exonuclease/phosphatase family metal-dependent hydrolase
MLFFLLTAIQNSIIPVMEQMECVEYLPKEKFAPKQFEEIVEALEHKNSSFRVMSYNVLFAFLDHHYSPEYRWAARLPRIIEVITDSKADVMGFQEVEGKQLPDLIEKLGKLYGNYETIFFNKARFAFLQGHTWKVSEKNDLVMALLQDLRTKNTVAIFNIHLSYGDIQKRQKEVVFLKEHLQNLAIGHPTILLGDFNTFPSWVDYDFPFFDGSWIEKELEKTSLQDALKAAVIGHIGPTGTFTNQIRDPKVTPFTGTGTPGVYLDHFFVSEEIAVLLHAVNPAKVDNLFPSDHMPLLMDCYTKKNLGKPLEKK